jgi:hypothetical protein
MRFAGRIGMSIGFQRGDQPYLPFNPRFLLHNVQLGYVDCVFSGLLRCARHRLSQGRLPDTLLPNSLPCHQCSRWNRFLGTGIYFLLGAPIMDHLLQETDRHIAECLRRIEEQRKRILELERLGENTTRSQNVLATLIHFHSIAELRRETLLRFGSLG